MENLKMKAKRGFFGLTGEWLCDESCFLEFLYNLLWGSNGCRFHTDVYYKKGGIAGSCK